MKWKIATLALLAAPSLLLAQPAKADKYRPTIDKGLVWLAAQQNKDGSWGKDAYLTSSTAFAGQTLLADGNTLTQGKYSAHLRRALVWFVVRNPAPGLRRGALGDLTNPASAGRYMSEHGVAMSFLAQAYGDLDREDELRAPLRGLLIPAIEFSVTGQSSQGGWIYTAKGDPPGSDAHENVTTMLVLQGLIDARHAGLPVPQQCLKEAWAHLEQSTAEDGSIVYSRRGAGQKKLKSGGRPSITAMALAAFLPDCRISDEPLRLWLDFYADQPMSYERNKFTGFDFFTHYYVSKAVFHLKDADWQAAFPGKKRPDHLIWSRYGTAVCDQLENSQKQDGSWDAAWGSGANVVSMALHILLYESSQGPR